MIKTTTKVRYNKKLTCLEFRWDQIVNFSFVFIKKLRYIA